MKCIRVIVAGFLIGICVSEQLRSQDALAPEILTRTKRATVFVQVAFGPNVVTGSGFVAGRFSNYGFVATNSHVLMPALLDGSLVGQGGAKIAVVFNSGDADAEVVKADVVAVDLNHDLAILKVTKKQMPEPILMDKVEAPQETQSVFVFGFPFGKALAIANSSPSPTVGRGSVSSIQRDQYGQTALVQIDGDINPGNSGGPIITRDGQLLGIAVAKVSQTQIGFAIPAERLVEIFRGVVASSSFGIPNIPTEESRGGTVQTRFSGSIFDPYNRIKSVSVLFRRAEWLSKPAQPEKDGHWEPLSKEMETVDLTIGVDRCFGDLKLFSQPEKATSYLYQTRIVWRDDTQVYSAPSRFDLLPNRFATVGASTDGRQNSFALPKNSGVDIGIPRAEGALKYVELDVDAAQIVDQILWSSDRTHLFVLSQQGLLRKIEASTFRQVATIDFGLSCSSFGISQEGLVVGFKGSDLICVVDDKDLTVKRPIAVRDLESVATGVGSSLAYVVCTQNGQEALAIVDLTNGNILTSQSAAVIQQRSRNVKSQGPSTLLSRFQVVALTPDGQYVFCSSVGYLYRISALNLQIEERSPRIYDLTERLDFSPDSRFVAVPSTGELGPGGFGEQAGAYVFDVNDLSKPTVIVPQKTRPSVFTWDVATQKLYTFKSGKVVVNSSQGQEEATYKILDEVNRPRHLSMHPDGGRFCLLTDKHLVWLDLGQQPKLPGRPDTVAEIPGGFSSVSSVPSAPSLEKWEPKVDEQDVVQKRFQVNKLEVAELKSEKRSSILMTMSADGKNLFLLHNRRTNSLLQKIRLPQLRQIKTLEFPRTARALGQSSEGLVVLLHNDSAQQAEACVVDESNLFVRARIKVGSMALELATTKDSPWAFVTASGNSALQVVDLQQAQIVRTVNASDIYKMSDSFAQPPNKAMFGRFESIALAPEGRYLFCKSNGQLWRLELLEDGLRFMEASPILQLAEPPSIDFLAGSRLVAVPVNGRGNTPDGHTKLDSGFYIYAIDNLQKPRIGIEAGPPPRSIALDVTRRKIYSHRENKLRILSAKGELEAEYVISPPADGVRQMALDTAGRTLFFLTSRMYVIDLSAIVPDEQIFP